MATPQAEPVLPVWFIVWALCVVGVLLAPDAALLEIADWLFAGGLKTLVEGCPAPCAEVLRAGVVRAVRFHGVALAFGYLVVRGLTCRIRGDAERVEQGLPA